MPLPDAVASRTTSSPHTSGLRPTGRTRRTLAVVALTAAAALAPLDVAAQDDTATRSPEARADEILRAFDSADAPGVLVAVVRGGEVVYQRAVGMANLSHGVPLTIDTRTNIGSTAKQFTGFAFALLEEQGRLSLDDDVRRHLPELPDLGETVTLRHLLTHTSGYRELLNALAIGGWRIEDADHISREEAVRVVKRQPELQNSPGAEWNYNNTGYMLLAAVLERATGEPYEEWLAENVLRPLGMTETIVRANPGQIIPRAAYGYLPLPGGGFREAADIGNSVGAGSVYTTLGDLARWMRNLSTAELGGRAVIERMTTPYVLSSGQTTTYGLGIEIDREGGLRRLHHPGGDVAHRSYFSYFPELDAGIIVVSNHGGFPGRTASQLTRAFFGDRMEPAPAPEQAAAAPATPPAAEASARVDPAVFDRYVGRYELEIQPGLILGIRRDGDRMVVQAAGQPATELTPTSESTFTITANGAAITFHRQPNGEVNRLTLHQGGNHAARRLPDADGPDLSAYAGRYYSPEFDTFYTVSATDGGLTVAQRRRAPIRIAHVRGDTFAGPFPLLEIVFQRDESGAVTALRASNVRARGIRFERAEGSWEVRSEK